MISTYQKLKNMISQIDTYNEDLNDISKTGVVYAGSSATNKPKNANGYCVTFIFSSNNKKQIYYNQTNTNVSFERTCNSGVWTEWISKQQTITTGVEYETGRIIDGKKEYGKIVTVSKLPNSTTLRTSHNISNIDMITGFEGEGISTSGAVFSFNFINISDSKTLFANLQVTKQDIVITSNYDISSYSGRITIFYTKN